MSVQNRQLIHDSNEPFQILPERTRPLFDTTVKTYFKSNKVKSILIHTSYLTRIWKPEVLLPQSKQSLLINSYCNLANRINTKYILVHGPSSPNEFEMFAAGLAWLKDLESNQSNIKFCIEIPAFTKSTFEQLHIDLSFIEDYFQLIVNAGFQIVIDTAHLHSNGLDVSSMIHLLIKFKDNYDWIHLNGNCKPMFTSDKHTTITSNESKIVNVEPLLKTISKLGKICVCEIVYKNRSYWTSLANKYEISLVSKDISENL